MSTNISSETLKATYHVYDLIIRDIMETVGFISGGFCPDPCEHTTLQHTDPKQYDALMTIWNDYSKYRIHLLTILDLENDPESLKKYLLSPETLELLD